LPIQLSNGQALIIVQSLGYKFSKLKHLRDIERKVIPHRSALVLIRLEKMGPIIPTLFSSQLGIGSPLICKYCGG
jgi:hypothetical protein